MEVSYIKLWKLLIDKNISAAELRKQARIAPNTMTKLKKGQEVSLRVLSRICEVLKCDISEIVEFVRVDIDETLEI